jgi:predicted ArsR family transcriptional regulator
MKQTLALTKQVIEVGDNKKLKTKVKIRLIRELMPQQTVQYIADILKISRQAVHRHL